MAPAKHRRRWFQFSTKALLALVFVVSVPLAWVALERAQRNREKRVAIAIEKLGGIVRRSSNEDLGDDPSGPGWLRALLGGDFFILVLGVDFSSKTELTDADLPPLETLVDLVELRLDETSVSDEALSRVKGLHRLTHLSLCETRITDNAVPRLKRLRRLERLDLSETLVTAAGIAELQSALPKCNIVRYDEASADVWRFARRKKFHSAQRGLARIHSAAMAGDVEAIRAELARCVPVDLHATTNYGSWKGTTPLMWATARGQTAAVRLLIAAGADVNAENCQGVNALMSAAGAIRTIDGDALACVRLLLEAGANPDRMDEKGRTPLFYACGKGAFFDKPPNAFLPPELRTADSFSRMRPRLAGDIGGHGGISARSEQLRHGDSERVAALVDAHANVNALSSDGSSALMAAASTDVERLRRLLDAGAEANRRDTFGRNALWAAADGGTYRMFVILVEAGLTREPGLLTCAAGSDIDAAEKVQWLLDDGADVDEAGERGQIPLVSSLWFGSSIAAPVLLKAGADHHRRDPNREGMLLLAAQYGSAEALKLLLQRGLDPNQRSIQFGHPTALILAAESNREAGEKVHRLLAAGVNMEEKNDDGETAILAASRAGNMSAVVALAEAGANVNVVAPDGHKMTPLLYVANRGDQDYMCEQTGGRAARALIERGANVHATDEYGDTARRLASWIHHDEVLQVLDEFGG